MVSLGAVSVGAVVSVGVAVSLGVVVVSVGVVLGVVAVDGLEVVGCVVVFDEEDVVLDADEVLLLAIFVFVCAVRAGTWLEVLGSLSFGGS